MTGYRTLSAAEWQTVHNSRYRQEKLILRHLWQTKLGEAQKKPCLYIEILNEDTLLIKKEALEIYNNCDCN
jgi:hypothetical protein